MQYNELHNYLKQKITFTEPLIQLSDLKQKVRNHTFNSDSTDILKQSAKNIHDIFPESEEIPEKDQEAMRQSKAILSVPDNEIPENASFRYHVFHDGDEEATRAIILLHGFNERSWQKYLPWASSLAKSTKAAVILFPIAFHMNRSPSTWNDQHLMRAVSQLRKKRHPYIVGSTLSNAAISIRISANPGRFFWSGLQSFHDVNSLAKGILEGKIPGIKKDAAIDLFTYSIGTFLGEIVMMTDEDGMFRDSRMGIFCGGPVFNRLSPVSKFILDSEGSVALYSYMVEHLVSHIKLDSVLAGHLHENGTPVGKNFRALLNYKLDQSYREEKLRDLGKRLYAIALKQDEVVPAYEMISTLQGSKRDIPIQVEVMDPSFPHRHEDPFPVGSKNSDIIDSCFKDIFQKMEEFLA
ncbi:MAG: DUF6051 family protein [Deltaproteobacteria bacterium]|jgi:hypothetical protein|nr:DUF6051 family protein [Deltaproteobacteria bacterium]